MESLHLYGCRIGTIKFECLRHGSVHEAYIEIRNGKMETTCPVCSRRYIMNEDNRFYCDRPLRVIEIKIVRLEQFVKDYNQVDVEVF